MAKTVQVEVDVSVKGDQSIDKLNNTIDDSGEKFVSLRRQIRETTVELQALADKGKTGTQEFTELNLKLSELRTEQEQVANKTQSLTTTFSLMGGEIGEFGDKAEVGIQALKTISSFTLQDIKNQFLVVGKELGTFVGKIADASGITKLYTVTNQALASSFVEMGVAEETAATAASTLSAAFIATGIGALIVAVGLLAANWDKVEDSLRGTTEEEELYNKAVENTNKDIEKFYENLISVRQSLEAAEKGVISKKEALKIYNDTLGDALGKVTTFEEAEKRANSPEAVTAYVQAQVKKAEAQILLAKAAQAAADAASGKGYDLSWWEKLKNAVFSAGNPVGYLIANLKAGAENTKELTKTANEAAAAYGKLVPKGAEAAAEKAKKEKVIRDNADAIERKDLEIQLRALQAIRDKFSKLNLGIIEDDNSIKNRTAAAKKENDERIKREKEAAETISLLKINSEEKQLEWSKTHQTTALAEEIKSKEAAAKKEDTILDWLNSEKKKKLDENLMATKAALDIAGGLVDQGSDAAKGIAIAQTTIDTYQSATAAYKAVVGIPVVGPGLAIVAAAAAVAAGIANVDKILSTDVPKMNPNSPSSASSIQMPSYSGIPSISAPVVNTTTGVNPATQIGQSLQNANQQPIRAYVVSSDISTQQQLDRKVNRGATFGLG